ncbi:MAG: hypothetical protein IPO21_08385 [Bacteroidales bacterium]|nr:hypothetical protein [Bacteroidales bacterium]
MIKDIKIIIGFLMCLQVFGYAQETEQLDFKHISTSDGLSQSIVVDIIQDHIGYMWFATHNGLNKYDGYTFTHYINEDTNSKYLQNRIIQRLHIDKKKNLWVGSNNGLGLFDYEQEKIFNINSLYSGDTIFGQINCFLEDIDNILWIAGSDNLFKIDFEKNTIKAIGNYFDEYSGIVQIAQSKVNTIYMAKELQVYEFDPIKKTQKLFFEISKHEKLGKNEMFGIMQMKVDKDGDVWIGTFQGNVYVYSINQKQIKKLNVPKSPMVDRFYIAKDGTFYLSLDSKGLFKFDKNTNSYIQITDYNNALGKIKSNKIRAIYIDQQNNLWLGHYQSGISYVNMEYRGFKSIKYNPDKLNSLDFPLISSIYVDSIKNMWIGCDGGGLRKIEAHSGIIKSFTKENGGLPDNAVINLTNDSEDRLWVGMYRGGLTYFDKKNEKYVQLAFKSDSSSPLLINDIRKFEEDGKGNIWLTTHGRGITKYNLKDKTFENFSNHGDESHQISILWNFDIMFDTFGHLWITSTYGLNRLNPNTKTFKKYFLDRKNNKSLIDNMNYCLFQDSKQRLWVGTDKGLCLFNYETETFTHFTSNVGLTNTAICAIEEGSEGEIWLSTREGIYSFNPETKKSKHFTSEDGLQGDEFTLNSKFKDKNGTIYFGGNNGLTYFNPKQLKQNTVAPKTIITTIELLGKKLLASEMNTEKMILKHNQNFLIFHFVAINYINTDKNQYKYILEGLETEWKTTTKDRKAVYTSLPPGSYTFKVLGSNNDGIWDTKGASFNFVIKPPFYSTWWFRISFSVIVLSLFIGYYVWKVTEVKNQNFKLEALIFERTKELITINKFLEEKNVEIEAQRNELVEHEEMLLQMNEELRAKNDQLAEKENKLVESNNKLSELINTKDKMLSIIAHDLKNPMNALMGFSSLLMGKITQYSTEKIENFIKIIYTSSNNAYNLLENLLTWARSQTGNITIEKQLININDIVNEAFELLNNNAEKKEISLHYSVKDNSPKIIFADRNTVSTIIRNLISNAIKFTNKNGEIVVDVKTDTKSNTYISISDNGVGMTESQKSRLFRIEKDNTTQGTENETGTGLGLIICKEFAQKNGAELTVESEVDKGTTFTLSFPPISIL